MRNLGDAEELPAGSVASPAEPTYLIAEDELSPIATGPVAIRLDRSCASVILKEYCPTRFDRLVQMFVQGVSPSRLGLLHVGFAR